ncbi:MAG: AI-2E family transporter [Lachnospiraceae bacterium]|nr:AI-2E family transporter [Lachnospiraceae bacterium]
MKRLDKKYIRLGILLVICTCICIGFYFLMKNGAESLFYLKDRMINIMLPFIDGIVLAYILNPIMKSAEEKLISPLFSKNEKLKKIKNPKNLIRGISVLITIVFFVLIVIGLILLIVPQLISSIQSIIVRAPYYLASLNRLISDLLRNNPEVESLYSAYSEQAQSFITRDFLPQLQSFISSVSGMFFSSVLSFLSNSLKFIIGVILCVYMLYKKEVYLAQGKKIIYAYYPAERANDIINNARFANKTFGGFLTGKVLDSLIIGIICFICTTIMRIPYALLISCVIGVTNIIPFFGPFLGAIPSALILLMINPMKSLLFVIFVIILQQIDGNIIGPKILGDSTGLPSFWVIFAITLFGGVFGVVGMVIGVPIFSIIYAAFKATIESKLKGKNMPWETAFYLKSDYYPENASGADKPEMSGEHLKLKNGVVSSKVKPNRSKEKQQNTDGI